MDFGTDRADRARPRDRRHRQPAAVIPLAFTSSTFVPVATMPGWRQAWANSNPITHAVDATRILVLGGPTSRPLLKAAAWILGLLAVVIPLPIYRYRRPKTVRLRPCRRT